MPVGWGDANVRWMSPLAVQMNMTTAEAPWRWNRYGAGVFDCPAVLTTGNPPDTEYTMNKAVASYCGNPKRPVFIDRVVRPDQVICLWEAVPSGAYCPTVGWYVTFDAAPYSIQRRHGIASNFMFADGHVAGRENLDRINWVWEGYVWTD